MKLYKNTETIVPFINSQVERYTGCRVYDGMLYGFEIELEGRNVSMGEKAVKGWRVTSDGSLRGENAEWVFSSPCDIDEAKTRIVRLFNAFDKNETRIKNSYRCSTHVHCNFSDKLIRQLINFFCVMTTIEHILEVYCGETREGNLFCLPCRDVESIVTTMERAATIRLDFQEFTDERRYCATNVSAINKFGTVEIRTMRGVDNKEDTLDWLNIIRQVYEYACDKMVSPARLCESLSFEGPEGYLAQIFDKETLERILEKWGERNLRDTLYEGVRLIQVFAYRIDEAFMTPFEPPKIKSTKKTKRVAVADGFEVWINPQTGQTVELPVGMVDGYRWVYTNTAPGRLVAERDVLTFNTAANGWYDGSGLFWRVVG